MFKSTGKILVYLIVLAVGEIGLAAERSDIPPGWLPVNRLTDETSWEDVRKIEDRVLLYFPPGDKPVRGIYLSVVFHSGDPREMARLWNFALVTIPWPMLWDVG